MFNNRSTDQSEGIQNLANAERVTDPSAVYDDVDSLPEWWRELVYEFAEHDLRVYRPSRLADETILYEVIQDLENRFDVQITVKCDAPDLNDEWKFEVDGTTVVTAAHERKPEGYTEYDITEQELKEAVSTTVERSFK